MKDLIGKYNRNREVIWFFIFVFFAIIALIHFVNSKVNKNNIVENISQTTLEEKESHYEIPVVATQDTSTFSANIDEKDIIANFIDFCNNGNIREAYKLLSLDCKEALYPTEEAFLKEYYNKIFNDRKTYSLQFWSKENNKCIYLIYLEDDLLSTGRSTNYKNSDYYTVVNKNNEYYLNINGFIEKKDLNYSQTNNNVDINIVSEEIYADYIVLNVNVSNQNYKKILLDSGENSNSVYVEDNKGVCYLSYLYEKSNNDLTILQGENAKVKIKFAKPYKNDITVRKVIFSDILLNYNTDEAKKTKIIIEW